jgi:hypothetical protein
MMRFCRNGERNRYLDTLESVNEKFFRKLFCAGSTVSGQTQDNRPVERTETILPITLHGSGDRDILFEAPSATVFIAGEYTGEGRFFLLRHTGTTITIIHATSAPDSFSEMFIAKQGQACLLEVRAIGPWSLRLSSPSLEQAKTLPFRILGQDRQVTEPFILTAGKKKLSISHYGAGRIVIMLRNSESTATIPVLDGRGPQEISRTIQNNRLRIGWLDVHAHGNWRIMIEEEPGADPES